VTTIMEERNDNLGFTPVMSKSQKMERISVLSRALYPPEIAGLINWYINNSPNRIDSILSEITEDAESRQVVVETNSQGFLEVKKN
jgi:hypothetical protein